MVAVVLPAVDRIFELSPDLIVITGLDGRFRRVNPAFESCLGYVEEEVLGRSVLDTAHPDDQELSRRALESLMRGDEVAEVEARLVARDGRRAGCSGTPGRSPPTARIYALGRDVTDRRLAEDDLRRLAGEQSALRRVATLVARGVAPAEVFQSVSTEAGRLLGAENTALMRFDADGTGVVMHDLPGPAPIPAGTRMPLAGDNVSGQVYRTGRTGRMDDYGAAVGPLADVARARGVCSSLGAPIVVEGRLWGLIVSSWSADAVTAAGRRGPAAAVHGACGQCRRQRGSSRRARRVPGSVVAAADATRRKLERDLHDGAQQRLVQTVVTLKLARHALREGDHEAESLIADALAQAAKANAELRELAHGILPGVLTRGGLAAGVDSLVDAAEDPRDRRRVGRPAAGGDRGQRVLRHRGGAHQRDQALRRDLGERQVLDRRRQPSRRGRRRRRRRRGRRRPGLLGSPIASRPSRAGSTSSARGAAVRI